MKTDQHIELSFSGTPEQAETIMLVLSHALSVRGIENRIVSPHQNLSYRELVLVAASILTEPDLVVEFRKV